MGINTNIEKKSRIAKKFRETFEKKDVAMSLRAQSAGSIRMFIRHGALQKVEFPKFRFTTKDDFDTWDGIELPETVYRRFISLVGGLIQDIESEIDYGYLQLEFKFEENEEGNWQEYFDLQVREEIQIPKY